MAVGLAGCATQAPRGTASPWYPPPLGTRVILPEAITIPARSARVYLQDGWITGRGVNHFAPHCQLEVNRVSDAPQTVPAGEFTVTDVQRRISEVVDSRAVQVAGRIGIGIGIGLFGSDVGDIMQAWHMRLHADGRADVRALICGGAFDHPSQAQTPSIDQMRRALGRHVILELPRQDNPQADGANR
ncbi:hypothetical protein TspCOW1_23210 [Thiohalobacter sp. COW1]|uniref:hypothetical protein n=1 Tax=Thiohalobacter sp. COW1 TaxID=2795687 RepID=UPI00191546D8|nr:hypothetical protein [Thiohalobacter sp. COW1]BCO32218.1 hypothetical protein TspCOW1_23210 [Thiohalobacter sp. COW1]